MSTETLHAGDSPSQIKEYWDDLLAFIDEKHVIPVVGPELLEIEDDGARIGLYDAVARRLLRRFDLNPAPPGADAGDKDTVILRDHHQLNDAVCALARRGKRVQDLYRPVHEELKRVLAAQPSPAPPAIAELASITSFDLFVTTTVDDTLERALNAVRFGNMASTESIEYAPQLSDSRIRDIPEVRSTGYTGVFYVFGRSSPFPQFAIHDEDLLEFLYGLQGRRGPVPERMLGAVRSRNLLLIGCNLADWLVRFFIRLANQDRLFSDRAKREFLVDATASSNGTLTVFLERFSQNTRVFPGRAADFVAQLGQEWRNRQPAAAVTPALSSATIPGVRRSHIFISYASEDRAAVRALVDDIKGLGGDIVWFDRHDLSAGDDWRNHILTAIRCCTLFVPVISAATEARAEGFFRREWEEAVERDLGIQGRTFIVPVTIDEPQVDPARYARIPDRFRKYHFGAAPRGRTSDAFRDALVQTLRAIRRTDQA